MKTLSLAFCVFALALSPLAANAQFAYVANEKDGTISVIDTTRDEVVGSIKAGRTPRGMAPSVGRKFNCMSATRKATHCD